MSGLDCGGHDNIKRTSSTSLKREMIIDYISGYINNSTSASISRVIIAGGGCAKPIKPENAVNSWTSSTSNSTSKMNQDAQEAKSVLQQKMKEMTLPVRELDLFLSEICSCGVPVDFIPGLHDPTNVNWPQKPIHECLVPNANVYTNMLSRTPNPYEASIGDKIFMGSDGLNIFDLRCNLGKINENNDNDANEEAVAVNTVDALHSSLKFNHLVPTGPDTVPTFPFYKNDPFIIENVPHVYFCGNCEEFETKLIDVDVGSEGKSGKDCGISQVRLICVPSFSKTGQVVLLKLKSLECSIVEFDDIITDSTADVVDDVNDVTDEKKIE
jgi:DNA polymerase delta subunit 2